MNRKMKYSTEMWNEGYYFIWSACVSFILGAVLAVWCLHTGLWNDNCGTARSLTLSAASTPTVKLIGSSGGGRRVTSYGV
jgi:hypothetical protein